MKRSISPAILASTLLASSLLAGVAPVQAVAEEEAVSTVAMADIPLPRPRPAGPGEVARQPSAASPAEPDIRVVQFGDKRVRVVGPDTPYAQAGQAGT